MKVLIRETLRTVGVNIYGADGKLHTEEYFEKHLADTSGIYPTLEAEQEEFNTDAKWTIITEEDFRKFADALPFMQKAIDDVQAKLEKGDSPEEYVFKDNLFMI